MTLADILTEIGLDFDQSISGPASTTSEYSRRIKLINRFERVWGQRLNYKWHELYTTASLTVSGATTTLPSDFKNGNLIVDEAGYLTIGNNRYKLIRADQRADYDTDAYYCYITGNGIAGHTLNINPTPSSSGTLTLEYYTTYLATDSVGTAKEVMTTATDQTKIPNPYYLIYSVLSVLFKTDDDLQKGVDYERMAFDALSDMLANQVVGNMNQDMTIPDLAEVNGYANIGQ